MNERIRELSKQANANELSYAYYRGEKRPENAVTLHSVDLELFAELIVRECVQSIEKTIETNCDNGYEKMGCEFAITDMLEHFGVGE